VEIGRPSDQLIPRLCEIGRCGDQTAEDLGIPHRDVLGAKQGLRYKRWMDDISVNEAFEYAIRDRTENAAIYLQDYLAH